MTRIEQIRQREQVTGWGTFGELHADVTALLSAWDTRDAALRTLVEQLRAGSGASHQRALDVAADCALRGDFGHDRDGGELRQGLGHHARTV